MHKKAFFKILNGFYLICPFYLKKIGLSPTRVEKNFFEIGRKGYQKKRYFMLISKSVDLLRQEFLKDFFSEKHFFAKFA
jgi:hypothetical protein